jgi:hypothetical protein
MGVSSTVRVTCVDDGPFKPLTLRRVNVLAENIRNIRSQDDGIELDYFRPLTSRQNVSVQRGTLAAKGRVSPTGSMD